jgi:hypothetical protein
MRTSIIERQRRVNEFLDRPFGTQGYRLTRALKLRGLRRLTERPRVGSGLCHLGKSEVG